VVLPRPVLKVGLGSLYVNLLFLDPALWVAEMIFTAPIYSRGGVSLLLPLTPVVPFLTRSLLCGQCFHLSGIECSFICL
jgi:hypothetical protein